MWRQLHQLIRRRHLGWLHLLWLSRSDVGDAVFCNFGLLLGYRVAGSLRPGYGGRRCLCCGLGFVAYRVDGMPATDTRLVARAIDSRDVSTLTDAKADQYIRNPRVLFVTSRLSPSFWAS